MKIGQRTGKRIGAWLLVLVMVAGLVAVPARKAEAASAEVTLSFTTGEQSGTGDAENHVETIISVPDEYNTIEKIKNAGATSLVVSFKITSAETTGSLAAQAFINAKDNWLSGWKEVGSVSDNTITSTVDLTSLTGSGDVWNFGLQILNVTKVTYEITSAKLILSGSSSGTTGGEKTDFGTTRDYSSGVSVTISNQGNPSNDWSGFEIAMNNNSGSTICDWIIKLQVPSGTASAFKCWNATFAADGDIIYMYPMQTGKNAVIQPGVLGADIPGGGFSGKYVDASSISVLGVYYNKGTSSSYDYSSGDTNDETGGTGGGGNSGNSTTDTSTNKDLDVEYNYAKLLQESLYFYDANMCGNLEGTCGLNWRGNCHTYDANVSTTINGVIYNVDVSGGFHDAGDHVKFGLPQGYAATMLEMSYYQFPDAYTSTGQKAHLQKITNYFCDYFKRCTVYDSSGKVVGFCYQVGDGNTDHGIWSAPEGQTLARPAYFATASNPATDEVSVAIAALAMNYINFGDAEDLKAAQDLFTFVKNNSKACAQGGEVSGFYWSESWQDDYGLAAAALYVATNDSSYRNEYTSNSYVNTGWVLDWANTGALACMLMKDSSSLSGVVNAGKNCSTIDGVFNCLLSWGSCRYNAASGFVALVYDKLANTATYDSWVVSQMNYMIGDNPNKRCYIVGYNENSSQYPHHRAASRSSDAGQTNENHYTLLGAMVGGPGKDGTYKDNQNDYNCNEVALDYNAGLVGALAGLYCAHKNDTSTYLSYAKKTTTNYSTALATSEELSAVGVTTYYGDSSNTDPVAVTGVTLDSENLNLTVGDTADVLAVLAPANATNKKVTWSSSAADVVQVEGTGTAAVVTALKSGEATITVRTEDGDKTAACKVIVTNPVTDFTLNKTSMTIEKGKKETLSYTTTPDNPDAYSVTWNSDNSAIASVNALTGEVTANARGTTSITAILTRTADSTTILKKCTVTVTVPLTGITLNTAQLNMEKNETTVLTASPSPIDAELGKITWSSDNTAVAKVESTGDNTAKVTALKSGEAVITASYNGKSVTCTVQVTTPVSSVAIAPASLELEKGKSGKFTATVLPSDADVKGVTWKSNDTNVATVDSSGNVTAGQTIGTATITATTIDGAKTATSQVKVVGIKVTSVSLKNTSWSLEVSDIKNLQTELLKEVLPDNADDKTVTWTSDNPSVAQVEGNSLTALKEGNAVITATVGNCTAKCNVTVTKKVQSSDLLNSVVLEKVSRTKNCFKLSKVSELSTNNTSGKLEYSVDNKNWISEENGSITFSGLSPFTRYTVFVRWAGSDLYKPSESVACNNGVVYTLVENPYIVDVSKLEDSNYVSALKTVDEKDNAHSTVQYDGQILTLLDHVTVNDSGYTLIGSNSNVTIKTATGNYKLTLNNTTLKKLDASDSAKVDLNITGISTIGEISSTAGNQITISGSGTLNITSVNTNGSFTVNGGSVTVDDNEMNKPAISAETVVITGGKVTAIGSAAIEGTNVNISGGSVTATGRDGSSAIKGNNINITGGTVTANGGIAATGTVDISGNTTSVTATGSDGKAAIAGNEITVTNATVTATGGSGAAAILSTGNITMTNADVTANTTGNSGSPAIQAGEGDDFKITIDGGTVTGNNVDNMYSKNPVDSQGNLIATYKVSIVDEAANRNETKSVNAGSAVALQAAGKKGYKVSWKDQTGKTYANSAVVMIESDVTFTAVYTKISVTSVKLTISATELEAGKTATATVKVTPSDAADASVTWSSSNPSVATVDNKGIVTAKAKGSATITATSNDTGVSDSVAITVKESLKPGEDISEETDIKATSISLTASVKGASSVPVKSTYKLAPKKSMTLKVAFAPENSVKEKVTFKSSNTKIAKVNAKGKITAGKKAGKATITVTSENGLKKTFKVQVMKKAVTKVKIKAPKKIIKVKKTVKLKATTSPSKKKASNVVYWKSSNPKVATVSSTGKVKGIKKGKVRITAIATDGSGKKATITIKVK